MPETSNSILTIISLISGLAALLSAYWTYKTQQRKEDRDDRRLSLDTHKYLQETEDSVNEDTVGLYRQLSQTYASINEKDVELLRKVTYCIRKMIVLQRAVSDLTSDMEARLDTHLSEARSISCPFYDDICMYLTKRISSLDNLINDTMIEVDQILLGGKEIADG